jgi:hypothetical protein
MNWTLFLQILADVEKVIQALISIFAGSTPTPTPAQIHQAVKTTLDAHAKADLANATKDQIGALKSHLTTALITAHQAIPKK